uniref:Uncharacterized protein n=1 Tax=Amorphochlora amoebiformis TaxID=1561963 RepID=A0A7S0CR23_9EUKA|mmetsp:Transcript_11993/g.19067  ORF Transcript_11993/g.19067 Transcript_11993/m.19067 type:complete len:126 (+) Transcript_11993:228-605(+)
MKQKNTNLKMKKTRQRVEAKNSLENYAYNIRSTIRDEKIQGKITEDEKRSLEEKVNEIIGFIENNEEVEKEKYEEKEEQLKAIANPIISKIYQQGGTGSGMEDYAETKTQEQESQNAGPKIEEVD